MGTGTLMGGNETTGSGSAGSGSGSGEAAVAPAPPAIVVRGDATPEQVAALVAVLAAASGGEEPASDDGDLDLGSALGGDAPPGQPRPRRLAHLPARLTRRRGQAPGTHIDQ